MTFLQKLTAILYSLATATAYAEPLTLLAAGGTLQQNPLLIVSHDTARTWLNKSEMLSQYGSIHHTSCLNNICIAVGREMKFNKNGSYFSYPLIAVSHDAGNQWKSTTFNESRGEFHASDCIKYHGNMRCFAVGEKRFTQPLFAISSDDGAHWVLQDVSAVPVDSNINAISCSGQDDTAACVMVVQDLVHNHPVLVTSSDAGSTWVNQSKNLVFAENSLIEKVSCTGDNKDSRCVVVGNSDITNTNNYIYPILAVSGDSAKTWQFQKIISNSPVSKLRDVSCTGRGEKALCVAVGSDGKDALIWLSADSGVHWERKPIAGVSEGDLTHVSCTGDGATATCAATTSAHFINDTFYPALIIASQDGGRTWTKSLAPELFDHLLLSIHCALGQQGFATCIAGGVSLSEPNPPLFVSHDSGRTWERQYAKAFQKDDGFESVNVG